MQRALVTREAGEAIARIYEWIFYVDIYVGEGVRLGRDGMPDGVGLLFSFVAENGFSAHSQLEWCTKGSPLLFLYMHIFTHI